jgi:hypothetical protein
MTFCKICKNISVCNIENCICVTVAKIYPTDRKTIQTQYNYDPEWLIISEE